MVNQLCEEKGVFEHTGGNRNAEEFLKALHIAVHNDSKNLKELAEILQNLGNSDLFELIWNDYCKI